MSFKIVICSSPNTNSIPLYFYLLANFLQKTGNEVHLILDRNGDMVFDEHPPEKGLTIAKWPNARPVRFKDFLFFKDYCEKVRPDIVISQFSSNFISLLVGRLLNIPHSLIYWHTMQEQLEADLKFSKLRFNLLKFRKSIVFNLSDFQFLTNSNDLKNELKTLFPSKKNKIEVVNYLMPDPLKNKEILHISEREFQISFVARLEKSKGHASFIRAFSLVRKNIPNLKLKIAGSGSELDNLITLVKELSLENHVEFLGECSYQEVLDVMSTSLIHVSNSSQEAFGMVNVEALATGTPIIANKVGGIKEILIPGKNGEFFDANNPEELEIILLKLLNNDNWLEYSQNARSIFKEKFECNQKNLMKQKEQLFDLIKFK
ncbi:MAG: glycosyltransferase family 4 protein [Algoriphagus sp.]|uniref:glycosyltransferase family 4 protein n=1 Tax=Algoriphagus sp. TaxID=1872435 RepID=UPI00262ACA9B|nr:glycosyltransferase family 4 protein [Algoriphagus sp.]MDG1275697.1 glycosyltransferase family 4 protein [Algoriphagus sp.]